MRTSESKTIINQELFDVKLPDYQRIIERLVSKYNVVDGSYYEGLVRMLERTRSFMSHTITKSVSLRRFL